MEHFIEKHVIYQYNYICQLKEMAEVIIKPLFITHERS